MKWYFVFISFLVGLLSLGEEIAWVRIVSFLGHSVPQSFSFVLFCYIAGIAVGALLGPGLTKLRHSPLVIIASLLLFSGLVLATAPWIISTFTNNSLLIIVVTLLIFVSAGAKGAIFPLVHHWFTTPGKHLGRSLSWVYFANVIGSAMGPLVVGFFLLDKLSMFAVVVLLAYAELLMAGLILLFVWRYIAIMVLLLVGISSNFIFFNSKTVLADILAQRYAGQSVVSHIIENRHGVIFTLNDLKTDDVIVYGGNVYDGTFNVDLNKNSNKIDRAFLLAALQPAPIKVLVIGLSSGSWLRVVGAMPGVGSIDVVEINKGYAELMNLYPGGDHITKDPRISFFYTDGRQLVQRAIKENKKYDLIVMNNTWHWRAYSTNLLSIEFMSMLQQIMSPGAVAAFNSTGSMDVVYTATQVFHHTYMHRNFVYVSDQNLKPRLKNHKERLCQMDHQRIDNQHCEQENYLKAVDTLITTGLIDADHAIKAAGQKRKPEVITDDNMILEYRYGMGLSM